MRGGTPDIVFAGLLSVLDTYEATDLENCDEYAHGAIENVFALIAMASRNDTDKVEDFLYRAAIDLAIFKLSKKDNDTIEWLKKVFKEAIKDENEDKDDRKKWVWPPDPDIEHSLTDVNVSNGNGPYEFREISGLRVFGYSVGKSGWTKTKRHEFLSDFMELELPKIIERTFGNEYGEPMTTTRLRKVAYLISGLRSLSIARNDSNYQQAISDWSTDLEFLKKKYYDGAGLKFKPWPEPEHTLTLDDILDD